MATKKQMTYKELADYINNLSEDQKNQPVTVVMVDEPAMEDCSIEATEDDLYYNINDYEDCGTLSELKEIYGKDFNQADFRISKPKGTVYINVNN